MFSFEQKRKLRSVLDTWWLWALLFLVAAALVVGAYDRYVIARDMAERRIEVEQELLEIERRRSELETEVQYLTNERGIEAEMRRQFDIARPGEQVVIILDDDPATTTLTTVEELPKRPWYHFW